MRLYDQHLHSKHSFDSKAEPEANVERALSVGLAGLTFTEHFDTHPDDWKGCIYDDAALSDTIHHLRDRYGHRIFVGKGIEVCYQPDRMDFILDFLSRHSFDIVLLSVHYFGGRPVHQRESWEGLDAATGTRSYLEGVLDAVRFCEKLHRERGQVFHVLSHLDMCKRYTQRWFQTYDISRHDDLMEQIMQACVAADLVPEINTSSLRQGLTETMPSASAVKMYARAGGTAMSLGSDAHRAEDVGAGFDHAIQMLRAAGIARTVFFKDRVRTDVEFSE